MKTLFSNPFLCFLLGAAALFGAQKFRAWKKARAAAKEPRTGGQSGGGPGGPAKA